MYFRCLLPVAVEMLFMSTASGSRDGFHIYCHFLVAVEVAVEMAVDFQSGSRKVSYPVRGFLGAELWVQINDFEYFTIESLKRSLL